MLQECTRNKNKKLSARIAATPPPTAERDLSPRNRIASSWILSGVIAGVLAVSASTGRAAEEPVHTQAQRQYDIPAGALDRVLKTFASQAGVMLSVDAALTAGKTSPGLKGNHTIAEGFEVLLAGAGLEAKETDAGSYSLRTRSAESNTATAADQSANVQTLGKIKVESDLAPDAAAEQGYRSEAVSAVGPWQGRSLQDTPYSITVIPRELIENLQTATPEQIYRVAPTVQLLRPQYVADNPVVNMRGFSVWSAYRDGLPGDPLGSGTTAEDVESVEIFTGLSGFLYGPANVGGMINYVSKRPTAEHLNIFTLGNKGGSNYYVQGDFGGPMDRDGRFRYRLNGIWQDGETAIDNMEIEKRFISGAFDWHVTNTLLWQFNAGYREYETRGGQPFWQLASGATRPSADAIDASVSWGQKWTRRWNETQRYGTQLHWNPTEAFSFHTAWQYNNNLTYSANSFNAIQQDGTYTQRVNRQYASGDDPLWNETVSQRGHAFADVRFETGSVAHKLTTGVQYSKHWYEQFPNIAPDIITNTGLPLTRPIYVARPAIAHVDRGARYKSGAESNTTVLIGDDIMFSKRWSLLAGVAHSTIDIKPTPLWGVSGYRKSAVTPNFSVIYKPAEAITTYATYIESLEQGGAAGNDYNGLPLVNAGEVFEPLISDQIEVGAKLSIGGMLLTTALFQIDKGLQYYDLSDLNAVRYVQDGRQVHRGIELTAFGKLTDDLTLTGGFTLLDAKIKEQAENPALEGKHPADVAEKFAKLRAEYDVPALPALTLIGGVSYTGHRYGDAMNIDRVPAYTLLDMGARYQVTVGQRTLTLRLDVNNLTDKAYWSQSNLIGDPRTVLFSVSAEF